MVSSPTWPSATGPALPTIKHHLKDLWWLISEAVTGDPVSLLLAEREHPCKTRPSTLLQASHLVKLPGCKGCPFTFQDKELATHTCAFRTQPRMALAGSPLLPCPRDPAMRCLWFLILNYDQEAAISKIGFTDITHLPTTHIVQLLFSPFSTRIFSH